MTDSVLPNGQFPTSPIPYLTLLALLLVGRLDPTLLTNLSVALPLAMTISQGTAGRP